MQSSVASNFIRVRRLIVLDDKWQVIGQFLDKAKVAIFTEGKFDGPNKPEPVAFDVFRDVAEHIVELHNKSIS